MHLFNVMMTLFCWYEGELKIHQQQPATETPKTVDSDDSDDIIVSPSRPLRKREKCFSPFSANDLN